MTRVLVTGASGFVGRAAVAALRLRGYEVHALARTAKKDVAAHAWHAVDLLDSPAASRVVREVAPSHLLHLAWTTAHGRYWSDPVNLAWTRATCGLFEAFAAAGGVRAVMSGTCAQYSWDDEAIGKSGVATEDATPRRPATLYGHAKQATTELLEAWSHEVALSYASALLFFPYGPYEKPDRLVPYLTRSLLAEEVAHVTAGAHVHDFIYVEDCAAALAALVDCGVTGSVNIGTGEATEVSEVAATIARILGREHLLHIEEAAPDIDRVRVVASIGRLRDEVGVTPGYELEAGLRATIEWWRGQSR